MTRADTRAAAFLTSLTWLRVALTPVVMALVLASSRAYDMLAACLFSVAAITDFVDGRLARRWKRTSALGAFLDTTADKILVAGCLVALVGAGRASVWAAFLIVSREILVLGLKGVASAARGEAVAPSLLGKVKAAVQFFAIGLAIVRPDIELAGGFLDEWGMWIAAAITVWSGADYLVRYGGLVSRSRTR